MYEHRLLSEAAKKALTAASTSVVVVPPKPFSIQQHTSTPVVKKINFPNQYEYDEWLSLQTFIRGGLYTWTTASKFTTPHMVQSPHVTMVLAAMDDYTELTWDTSGQPRFLFLAHCADTAMSEPRLFWGDLGFYRKLEQPEIDIVMGGKYARLQAHIEKLAQTYNIADIR